MFKSTDRETYVKLEVVFITLRPISVLVEYFGDREWIPRSTLSYRCDKLVEGLQKGEEFQLEVAEWKANEIGFI